MTRHHDSRPDRADPLGLPEFTPEDSPEFRVARWSELLARDDEIPEDVLDAALVKLLDQIRQTF